LCRADSARAKLLKLDGVTQVLSLDYAACIDQLAREGAAFDFAFLDAPYADGTAQKPLKCSFRGD
jgi:16S rRNA G966 N2-methylase RsmD